jgi:deoxycytidine triphosphate deaminase
MEALDVAQAAASVDAGRWDLPPKEERLTPSFWADPEPGFQGMLSADRIRAYHYEVGRMIRPFQEARLQPAAYELTLGPRWLIEGETRYLTDEQPLLKIPPNSIVFVSMREMLLLPHWLVARFDLSIQFIYDGLLLGTGPQVDPGFKGVLSCPLHNISSQPITLEYKQPFAKMDFVKTSLGQLELTGLGSQDDLYAKVASRDVVGFRGEPLKLWKVDKNYRRPIYFADRPQSVKSSVRELEGRVGGLGKEVRCDVKKAQSRVTAVERTIRRSQVGVIVAAIGLGITAFGALYGLGAILTDYTDGRIEDSRAQPAVRQLQTTIDRVGAQLGDAQVEQRRLRMRLRELDAAVERGR